MNEAPYAVLCKPF